MRAIKCVCIAIMYIVSKEGSNKAKIPPKKTYLISSPSLVTILMLEYRYEPHKDRYIEPRAK